jgi:chromosome segregation protein
VYLSQLEIHGFKSFPERTILEFNGGVTAVVGPNGCGKTNILDSIRWVLGEQRSSALRSSKMEEIIFNGTAAMKPLGLAEVNLTIKNNRGVLPVEYDEVVITRRLYRSGESEYLLNKSQCRLKDIMELFYDTGMGPHAYSVIQQGMIDAILSDKAEDRRNLFEEAAGVTKYKHRKKEAIAKLEATEADLLRLGDIIAEIDKQVAALKRQAARARAYSRQKDELRQAEQTLAASLLFGMQGKRHALEERKSELQLQIEALNAEFEKREMSLQETRLKLSELERDAAEKRQKQAEYSSKASDIESEIKLNKHRVETGTQEIEKSNNEIVALESRINTLKQGIEDNSSRLNDLENQKATLLGESEKLESELGDKVKELSPCEASVIEIRTRNSSIAEKLSALKAESSSVSGMKINLESKLKELKTDTTIIDESRSQEEIGLIDLESKRQEIDTGLEEIRGKIADKSQEILQAENKLQQFRESIARDKAELSGLKARQELLGQLIDSGEGYSSGARALLQWDNRPSGLMSPLADILAVPEEYRVAVTAAMGDLGEVIPAKTFSDAADAIAYLKVSDGGRASFLVMDKVDLSSFNFDRPKNADGFIGYLDDLVTYQDDYRLAVNLLLGRVALFKSRELALASSSDWDLYTKVDLDGFVVMPSAIVTGGKAVAGVLGRRQDLSAVEDLIKQVTDKISQSELELSDNVKALQTNREELGALDRNSRHLDEEKRKTEVELGQLKFDFKEREIRYASALGQAEKIAIEIRLYDDRLSGIQNEFAELDEKSRLGTQELNDSSQKLLSLRSEVSALESKLTQARIKSIEHESLRSKLHSDIEHGQELCSEAEKMIASYKANIEKAGESIKSSLSNNEELETRLYDVFAERREIQSKLREVEDSITEIMEQTGRIDDEMSHYRKNKDVLTSDLHSLELEFVELESTRKSILDRLRMEFNLVSVEPSPLPEGKTIEGIEKEAADIRVKLSKMDPVNLMAAEDYEREKDRLDFLIRQRDDLLDAESSLKEAIIKINSTAEERFRETFQMIQANFERVFTTLFEGGEARLELEVETNPLESPIRIMARPGGKRLLSVAQLSGGERALTAISLLFSIYLVKPSPFCILDEVDAPLDDSNLLRFLKIIKKFSDSTQFIIITHNKMTMEASDILYGVTMETPGVSKVVSVKFADNDNGNGNGNKEHNGI